MTEFNSYMSNIDIDFFKGLCLKYGELRHYKRNEFILREGDICSFFGFILSGVVKYSCTNWTENKLYNVGFSFPNEFIADYPTCLYNIKSELNIQTITPCKIYICSSEFLQQKIRGKQRKSTYCPYRNWTSVFPIIFALFGFIQIHTGRALSPTSERCPDILQIMSLKEIASYLKITPVHMSRIRNKLCKR